MAEFQGSAPRLAEEDFLVELQALLPRGRAWPRDADANLTRLLRGFAKSLASAQARQVQLLTDAAPATAEELLPEWEAALGLPDPCIGAEPLISERQAHVVARLTNAGGQSVPYFIDLAARLGATITITEFTPFKAGMVCGQPCYGDAWAHAFQVEGQSIPIHYFLAGSDTAGNPLASWGNVAVLCELSRLKPGHTVMLFTAVGQLDFANPLDSGLIPGIAA